MGEEVPDADLNTQNVNHDSICLTEKKGGHGPPFFYEFHRGA